MYIIEKILTFFDNQVTKYKHDCMTAVNVISTISMLAVYRQAKARNELQNPFCNE